MHSLNCTGSNGALDIAGTLDDTQIYIDTVLFKDTLLLSDKQRRIAIHVVKEMVAVSSFLPELELPQAVMEPASIVRAHRQAVAFPKVFRFRFIFSFLIRTTPFHHPFQKEKRRLHVWFSRRPCQLKSEFFPFLQNAQRIFLERNLFFSV